MKFEENFEKNLEKDLNEESRSDLLKKRISGNTGFNCEKYKEAHFRRRN